MMEGRPAVARKKLTIVAGQVAIARKGELIETLLGSCVAVCLWDPFMRVGGMNHYMLPSAKTGDTDTPRYGEHAMALLLAKCFELGALKDRLEAKVFGGGNVMNVSDVKRSVSVRNVAFALDYLESRRIPIVAKDLGGNFARKVSFDSANGMVQVRRLDPREPKFRSRGESDDEVWTLEE